MAFWELLDGAGIRYKFNVTNHEFTIRNWNGTIWIASGDEPESSNEHLSF